MWAFKRDKRDCVISCTHLIMNPMRSLPSTSEANLDHSFANRKDTAATSNKDPIVIGRETRFRRPSPFSFETLLSQTLWKKFLALKSILCIKLTFCDITRLLLLVKSSSPQYLSCMNNNQKEKLIVIVNCFIRLWILFLCMFKIRRRFRNFNCILFKELNGQWYHKGTRFSNHTL